MTGFLHLNAANAWPTFPATPEHGLVIDGDGALRLAPQGDGLARRGVFRAGPFHADEGWFRLRAFATPPPTGTHVQLFTATVTGDAPYDPGADEPFLAADGWQAAPRDELDVLIQEPEAPDLWAGAILRGDGESTPAIHQMRADYGRDTALRFLPAIYGREAESRDFLERFLALPGSVLGSIEDEIADLPRLFDPAAAPAGGFPSWLGWLAGWLAFDLAETWSEEESRRNLAAAFGLYGRRGTVAGLRAFLKLYAGVEARIEEPARRRAVWTLGRNSRLGFTTQLAAAHAQGAVLDSTATLDASHLTRGEDFGAPLFDDDAHRFRVEIYAAELSRPGTLDAVKTVLEREKPAHTECHVCVLEPRMRAGVQARVGIDAIVAAAAPPARLGRRLGGTVLAAAAAPCGGGEIYPAEGFEPCKDETPEEETPEEETPEDEISEEDN